MPRKNHRRGRPQAVKRVWVQVVRRPEDEIDRRQLSLALIALERSLREVESDASPSLQEVSDDAS